MFLPLQAFLSLIRSAYHLPESLTHLFYECSVLHGLWSFVASVLLYLTGCQVNISLNAILFNIFKPHTVSHYNDLLMLLINLVKKIIWTLRNRFVSIPGPYRMALLNAYSKLFSFKNVYCTVK